MVLKGMRVNGRPMVSELGDWGSASLAGSSPTAYRKHPSSLCLLSALPHFLHPGCLQLPMLGSCECPTQASALVQDKAD